MTSIDEGKAYDVCFSFAGEDRAYVDSVAANLRNRDIQVFYDRWEQASLWGKNLYEHLVHVYRDAAKYCVLFISEHYARKVWANHERKAAQARAFEQLTEYVLPARFDDTPLPGLLATTFYVDLRQMDPAELAELIATKIGPKERRNFFPPEPDELYLAMKATDDASKAEVRERGLQLFDSWTHLNDDERRLVIHMVMHGCRAELPDLIHESVDKVERYTGFDRRKIRRLFRVLGEFGFVFGLRKQKYRGATSTDVTMRFAIFSRRYRQFQTDFAIYVLGGATRGFCQHHAEAALLRCDFGQLVACKGSFGTSNAVLYVDVTPADRTWLVVVPSDVGHQLEA